MEINNLNKNLEEDKGSVKLSSQGDTESMGEHSSHSDEDDGRHDEIHEMIKRHSSK
jgi:hypothetical protein